MGPRCPNSFGENQFDYAAFIIQFRKTDLHSAEKTDI